MNTETKSRVNEQSATARMPFRHSSQPRRDVVDLISERRREANSLFQQFGSARTANEEFELAQIICEQIATQDAVDEEILFPAIWEADTRAMIVKAMEDHSHFRPIVAGVQQLEPGHLLLSAKIKILGYARARYLAQQEEDLIPLLRDTMTTVDRQRLGERMLAQTHKLEDVLGHRYGDTGERDQAVAVNQASRRAAAH
jgi:hypothetical protein